MEFHDVANIFPMMTDEEYQYLVSDIKENGLIEPIWTYEGKIIDGRNRFNACLEANVEPSFREWNGNGSLVHFVASLNLYRRHLSSLQKAAVALNALPLLKAEAKQRQLLLAGTRPNSDTLTKDLVKVDPHDNTAASQAATLFGTNRQYISDLNKLQTIDPELLEEVRSGNASISQVKSAISDRPNYDGDEWKTPSIWIETARLFLGSIDVDPASNSMAQGLVNASIYFTKDKSGLINTWSLPSGSPSRVWLNPPYSLGMVDAFIEKAIEEHDSGRMLEGLVLVNNCTETRWFISLASRFPVMFGRGRVGFWYDNPNDVTPTRQGQALFYLGHRVEEFFAAFKNLAYAPNII